MSDADKQLLRRPGHEAVVLPALDWQVARRIGQIERIRATALMAQSQLAEHYVQSASQAAVTLEELKRAERAAGERSAGERQAFHQLKHDYMQGVVSTAGIVSDGVCASLAREIQEPPQPAQPLYIPVRQVGRAVGAAANDFLDGVFEVVSLGLYKGR